MLDKILQGLDTSDKMCDAMEDVGEGMQFLGKVLQACAAEGRSTDEDSPNRLTGPELGFAFLKNTGAASLGKL